MWKVLDKELKPLPPQMFGFRPGRVCFDIVSFLVEGLRKAEERDEKLFVISMDVSSAFDTVRAEILEDALLLRSASVFSAAAVVRENLSLRCRPCPGQNQCAPEDGDLDGYWCGHHRSFLEAPKDELGGL